MTLLVSFAAVFRDVTQRSPKETAAHIRTTFLSNCVSNNQLNQSTASDVIFARGLCERFPCSGMGWRVKRRKKLWTKSQSVSCVLRLRRTQEGVFIFGNSTHNFVEIIRSSLDFDISCYPNSKLFICKAVCYKRLLKFERATEKVLELKREILESFQGRPRAKRLFNAGD